MFRETCLVFLWLSAAGLAAGAAPVKLGVKVEPRSIPPGGSVRVHVELLDAGNRLAAAPKALKIQLQARLPSGKVAPLPAVEIAAGQSSADATVRVPGSGLVYIWAKHPELLLGGAFVQVKPESAPPPAGSRRDFSFTPPPAAPPPAPGPPANSGLQIDLRYSPERTFLADGKDSATILAFLSGGESISDIRLNVFDGSGSLKPTPMTIRRGASEADAAVTSDHPGTFSIEYLGSSPSARFGGNSPLKIRFVPPVTRLDLQASPPSISLLDTTDLIATLTDDKGRAVQTDQTRQVSFAIDAGQGGFLQKDVAMPAGSFQARTGFQPEWPGKVVISAATANLMTATAPVQVSLPVALLICSAAGGAAGGLLSAAKRRKGNFARAVIGLVTGFLLYWACIFLGMASLGRGVVLNPFSALAISAVGGWLQTEVFTSIWSALRGGAKG